MTTQTSDLYQCGIGLSGAASDTRGDDMELTLAEAIRQGAAMGDQTVGDLTVLAYDSTTHAPVVNSCAVGAAALGVGIEIGDAGYMIIALIGHYPELAYLQVSCPACVRQEQALRYVMMHLNDHHGWTREAIADWIENSTLDLTPVPVTHEVAVCIGV